MSREFVLPDLGMVQGRLLVSAWDYGLDDVQDDAAKMLLHAVEVRLQEFLLLHCHSFNWCSGEEKTTYEIPDNFSIYSIMQSNRPIYSWRCFILQHQLKNIITAVLSRRHGYKVRDGRFRHGMGTEVPPPHLRNTLLAHYNTTHQR